MTTEKPIVLSQKTQETIKRTLVIGKISDVLDMRYKWSSHNNPTKERRNTMLTTNKIQNIRVKIILFVTVSLFVLLMFDWVLFKLSQQ
jgi:hypothetical protein